jgi:hypothetical protein
LIRRFEPHPKYPEVRELYNLKEDIGESRNLAMQMPEKVKHLDALIDQFVKETGALYPKPNPDFRAQADATEGLVPRSCQLVKADGAIRVVGEGRLPFLGTASVKLKGPLKLTLTARSSTGGEGRVQWKLAGQETFPETGQSVGYLLPAAKHWQQITIELQIKDQPQIVRLYLPAQESPVELRSIRFQDEDGREKIWDFSGVVR